MDAPLESDLFIKWSKMLREKKDWTYDIDRELTGKLAIDSNANLQAENKKLKEDVDFYYKSAKQFREDAESWRKECERLLWLQLCWKTIAERIEEDKKVIRTDTSLMEEDTLQELRDLGEI